MFARQVSLTPESGDDRTPPTIHDPRARETASHHSTNVDVPQQFYNTTIRTFRSGERAEQRLARALAWAEQAVVLEDAAHRGDQFE